MSSQGREDAILAGVFEEIGATTRVAVEVGARDGVKGSNTHALRLQGWTCVLLDAAPRSPIVHHAFLTVENIAEVFAAHDVPAVFDLLSIDVDGNDFWLWQALLPRYTPRVVVIEYNSVFGPAASFVMAYDPAHHWDKTTYYGASAAALVKLGATHGYRLVDYTPRQNLIFVHETAWVPTLSAIEVPPADPCRYPSRPGRRWEVY